MTRPSLLAKAMSREALDSTRRVRRLVARLFDDALLANFLATERGPPHADKRPTQRASRCRSGTRGGTANRPVGTHGKGTERRPSDARVP
jgi:hypothetical protein